MKRGTRSRWGELEAKNNPVSHREVLKVRDSEGVRVIVQACIGFQERGETLSSESARKVR